MSNVNFILTEATGALGTTDSGLYNVIAYAATGKTATVASGTLGVVKLEIDDNGTAITKYSRILATSEDIVIQATGSEGYTGYDLGYFTSTGANAPTVTTGTLYGATFTTA